MARYTIHRDYEDRSAEANRIRKALAAELKLYILLVVLKEGFLKDNKGEDIW